VVVYRDLEADGAAMTSTLICYCLVGCWHDDLRGLNRKGTKDAKEEGRESYYFIIYEFLPISK
jgi:hypothetical protein